MKKWFIVWLCCIISMLVPMKIYAASVGASVESNLAAEESMTQGCWLKTRISNQALLQAGDFFSITCMNTETEETYSFRVNQKALESQKLFELNLPEGQYRVTELSYGGRNKQIMKQGFGIVMTFSVVSGHDTIVEMGIGHDTVAALCNTYAHVKVWQDGGYVRELAAGDMEEYWQSVGENSGETVFKKNQQNTGISKIPVTSIQREELSEANDDVVIGGENHVSTSSGSDAGSEQGNEVTTISKTEQHDSLSSRLIFLAVAMGVAGISGWMVCRRSANM